MDEKKHPTTSQTDHTGEEKKPAGAKMSTGGKGTAKRILAKRWIYPAIYLGAAVLIIGLMYVKSQLSTTPTVSVTTGGTSTTAAATPAAETFVWPYAAGVSAKVTMGFFPTKGTAAEQEAALVMYDHTYYPHRGIDITAAGNAAFPVTAAISGTVIKVWPNNPLWGNMVEVQSANGYVENYASLGTITVKQGQTINAGEKIGTAGTCAFEANAGTHLYFEVLQNNMPVSPQSLLPAQ